MLINVNRYLGIEFENFCPYFDKVITIDEGDAERYGLELHPFFYSAIPKEDLAIPESDCFYVGNAKERLDDLLAVYELFLSMGLKCDFHIVGVSEERQKYQESIIYNKPMNYDDVVCHIKKSKMLLEIMQEGQTSGTLREHEAVIYGKKLITNNKYIVNINSSQLNENEKDLLERLIVINKQVDRNTRNCLKIIRTITDENGKKICFSAKILKYLSKLTEKENDLFDLCRAYVKSPECDFTKENKPNFSSILNIIQEISNMKLKTKTEVMNNGFNSKLSIKKNTSYLYILNYMTLISNNILDFAFAFETSTKEFKKSEENNYQQLDIDDIEQLNSLTENLEQEEKTQEDSEEQIQDEEEKIFVNLAE